jgi:signal transduction histidine kinase
LLIRGISKPIEALMLGTDEIASGNLAYRIDLDSHDEFSYLAKHFNQMADELEVQQKNVSIGRAVLEKRVEERTIELHRLNGELQKMDTKRREFLADIGHELRTPITVIRGEAEVALRRRDRDEAAYQLDRGEQATAEETIRQRERDAEDYQDVLQRIVEMSIQLGKYVNDLLFLASAETASLQFEWDRVDLAELVTSAVEDFQVMAQENSITVWLDAPPTPVWVRGDKQRLRQVLFILGDNACRYSKPGGHITAILMADRKEAVFSLSDQGIGIPVQDLLRIFDRHFRSKNARRSRDDGSGLGLPMAKSILKAHGGKISVASIENAGSTFTVSLPLISPEQTGL